MKRQYLIVFLTPAQINNIIICCYTERRCKGTPGDTEVELGSSGDNPFLKVKAKNWLCTELEDVMGEREE